MKPLLLILPLVAVLLVSGCTDLSDIPFIGGLFGPATVKYTNDIIIIRSLDATPSTVFPGQQVRVVAYIQNQGRDKKDVVVDLYDYCEGTFHLNYVDCPGQTTSQQGGENSDASCPITLQPYETAGVGWTLTADECIALDTTCPADGLKVSVNYGQDTEGLTTITLIRYDEMQRQMSEGTYKETQPTRSVGEGPIKGYIGIEDKHPVAVSDTSDTKPTTVISFQLRNEGNGFLAFKPSDTERKPNEKPKVHVNPIDMAGIGEIQSTSADDECGKLAGGGGDLELIKSESPKIVCLVANLKNDFTKQLSKTLKFSMNYNYEFRSSVKVTVKPKALTALPDSCKGKTTSGGTTSGGGKTGEEYTPLPETEYI